MASVIIKKPSAGDLFIADVGVIIPGAGQETFTDPPTVRAVCASQDIRDFITAGTLVVNDGTSDLSALAGAQYLANQWSSAGLSANPGSRDKYLFGSTAGTPGGGTQQLLGAGNTVTGYRLVRSGTITAGSIQVGTADASRGYNLVIQINGSTVATVALAVSTLGAQATNLSVTVSAGDVLTAFITRTSGSGVSTFTSMTAVVEVTE